MIAGPCVAGAPWAFGRVEEGGSAVPRYNAGETRHARMAPFWWPWKGPGAGGGGESGGDVDPGLRFVLGSDHLGRSVLARAVAGGVVSLGVGVSAAVIGVTIGTLYGAVAAYAGGRVDGLMMRAVDVLYGLPYVLLVVLISVAGDSVIEEYGSRGQERAAWVGARVEEGMGRAEAMGASMEAVPPRRIDASVRAGLDVALLLGAIGGVSWLTLARVVRGEVLSLKGRAYVEAARISGAGWWWVLWRHLMPGLMGPVVVYGALLVPQAMLQESFLSFLGLGIEPPLPSWGGLAADGLSEVNPYRSHWWLLAVPCGLLAGTLVALNMAGEAWRRRLESGRGVGG